jgi:trimeric autotransporter adhesin
MALTLLFNHTLNVDSMISRFVLILSFLMATVINGSAQKVVYPKRGQTPQLPFGKKVLPPTSNPAEARWPKKEPKNIYPPYTSLDDHVKRIDTPAQRIPQNPPAISNNHSKLKGSSLSVHLTKDINKLSESLPRNYPANAPASFAVLNNISYFFAEDGTHGRELWRSNGTPAGTYLVKDIHAGSAHSEGGGIVAANGLLYFSAYTVVTGAEIWVSDGTSQGTKLLMDLYQGPDGSHPNQFVEVDGMVFFAASRDNINNQLWKTDGTEAGTQLVKDIQSDIGYSILEVTKANHLVYFIANTWSSGYQLFRSDGTDAGTYIVKETGYFGYGHAFSAPMQLTEYDSKLFFSVDDGGGRRLWKSDGTADGTGYATANTDVFVRSDYMSLNNNFPFSILNNILYLSASTTPFGEWDLYAYDAVGSDDIFIVQDFASSEGFVVPPDMLVVNNSLIFKVISNVNGWHDELWSLDALSGEKRQIKLFQADAGVYIYGFYNADGELYFVVHDNETGNELWKSDGTNGGTTLVRDINAGPGGSFPGDLTFCNGRLLFSAFTMESGNELWSASGNDAALLKDINTTSTNSSYAGSNFIYKGIGAHGDQVVFNAFTSALGHELYKSDGTNAGTVLLNDIWPGEAGGYPNNFLFKRNVTYFIGDNPAGTALYQTDGTTVGLRKITPEINRDLYFVVNYNISDNGIAFYTLQSRFTGQLELWRSDGTDQGTFMLTAGLSYFYQNYVAAAGKNVFFIAGDFDTGYELWESDGSIAGTKMVKDINPGTGGSDPYSLFVYKNEVYFGAYNGSTYSLWKSDGSEKGTFQLKEIIPAIYYPYFNTQAQGIFCVSNGVLYFSADAWDAVAQELWKTNGTKAGTTLVKDINPYYGSSPANLVDVNGTLYFTADDGVHGYELWKSNGTAKSTQLLKDIVAPFDFGYFFGFSQAGGKLFFLAVLQSTLALWSSDGTAENTKPVTDEKLNELAWIENLTGAGDKLFFGAFSYQYGAELYQGTAVKEKVLPVTSNASLLSDQLSQFDASVSPNPSSHTALLTITGVTSDVKVRLTDLTGRLIWSIDNNSNSQISLPVNRLAAGQYIITVVSGANKKILKLIRN